MSNATQRNCFPEVRIEQIRVGSDDFFLPRILPETIRLTEYSSADSSAVAYLLNRELFYG
jgi:hypothetical protein